MYSTIESVESPMDVIVHFTEEDWQKAKRDIAWATATVIEELRSHKSNPEDYFATKPSWAVRLLPWERRIRLEIQGHFLTNDRDIRFSEWWIVKLIR